jgi:hypothetical protein
MRRIEAICVFCGSSEGVGRHHREAAARLGAEIARRRLRLVYGGGQVGLMGTLADAALAEGGEVIGVIPEFLYDLEVAHRGLRQLHRVATMHDRKRRMAELADAFVTLPGGLGTLDETLEIVTWKQLRLHDKPIVVLNVEGVWDPLRHLVERLAVEGFVPPGYERLFRIVASVEEVFEALADPRRAPPVPESEWT